MSRLIRKLAGVYICSGCGEAVSDQSKPYAGLCRCPLSGPRPRAQAGPGTELKSLLRKIGIVAKPGCSCNKRAQAMDEKGCDWCEENIDLIDSWLAEEAKKRKLPYLSVAGKALIRMAIRRARKKGNG